ncbi:MAG: acyl-CoA thioesterase [Deltaproteobacteria bacterium]|nr:acyl-CoA thioesterase [Deltaproteobacteria bacterium]
MPTEIEAQLSESGTIVEGEFRSRFVVPPDAVDVLGHVNNTEYVRWIQDAALAHSNLVGFTWEACQQIGGAFVVRRQTIDYLREVVQGQLLEVRTRVEQSTPMSALRQTELRNEAGELVLTAQTVWVFMSLETRRPLRIPPEVKAFFTMPAGR